MSTSLSAVAVCEPDRRRLSGSAKLLIELISLTKNNEHLLGDFYRALRSSNLSQCVFKINSNSTNPNDNGQITKIGNYFVFERDINVNNSVLTVYIIYKKVLDETRYSSLSNLNLFDEIIDSFLRETQNLLRISRRSRSYNTYKHHNSNLNPNNPNNTNTINNNEIERTLFTSQRYQNLQNCIDLLNALIASDCSNTQLAQQWRHRSETLQSILFKNCKPKQLKLKKNLHRLGSGQSRHSRAATGQTGQQTSGTPSRRVSLKSKNFQWVPKTKHLSQTPPNASNSSKTQNTAMSRISLPLDPSRPSDVFDSHASPSPLNNFTQRLVDISNQLSEFRKLCNDIKLVADHPESSPSAPNVDNALNPANSQNLHKTPKRPQASKHFKTDTVVIHSDSDDAPNTPDSDEHAFGPAPAHRRDRRKRNSIACIPGNLNISNIAHVSNNIENIANVAGTSETPGSSVMTSNLDRTRLSYEKETWRQQSMHGALASFRTQFARAQTLRTKLRRDLKILLDEIEARDIAWGDDEDGMDSDAREEKELAAMPQIERKDTVRIVEQEEDEMRLRRVLQQAMQKVQVWMRSMQTMQTMQAMQTMRTGASGASGADDLHALDAVEKGFDVLKELFEMFAVGTDAVAQQPEMLFAQVVDRLQDVMKRLVANQSAGNSSDSLLGGSESSHAAGSLLTPMTPVNSLVFEGQTPFNTPWASRRSSEKMSSQLNKVREEKDGESSDFTDVKMSDASGDNTPIVPEDARISYASMRPDSGAHVFHSRPSSGTLSNASVTSIASLASAVSPNSDASMQRTRSHSNTSMENISERRAYEYDIDTSSLLTKYKPSYPSGANRDMETQIREEFLQSQSHVKRNKKHQNSSGRTGSLRSKEGSDGTDGTDGNQRNQNNPTRRVQIAVSAINTGRGHRRDWSAVSAEHMIQTDRGISAQYNELRTNQNEDKMQQLLNAVIERTRADTVSQTVATGARSAGSTGIAGVTFGDDLDSSGASGGSDCDDEKGLQRVSKMVDRTHRRSQSEAGLALHRKDYYYKLKHLNAQERQNYFNKIKDMHQDSELQQKWLSKEALDRWDFDSIAFNNEPKVENNGLILLCYHLITLEGFDVKYGIDLERFVVFLYYISNSYHMDNPYHNHYHATDVVFNTYYFMKHCDLYQKVFGAEPFRLFIMIVAAAIHDVDHNGTNNDYHVMTASDLALIYNDQSILENHHISYTFDKILNNEKFDCDWTSHSKLDQEQKMMFRKYCIKLILATDMAAHKVHEQEMIDIAAEISKKEPLDDEMKGNLLKCLLHVSDVGNTLKGQKLCVTWAERVVEEFRQQGDNEIKRFGKIVQKSKDIFDRKTPLYQSQLGWIKFVMAEFVQKWAHLNPDMEWLVENVEKNKAYWETMKQAEESGKKEVAE